jgi:hyperosmotically inducible periplasmic protein
MQRRNPVPDRLIAAKAAVQLVNRGIRSPCEVTVQVRRGVVTLSGKVEFEHQRTAAIHAVRQIDGANYVVDHLSVMQKTSVWA